MSVCTLDDIKDRLGISSSEYDTLINSIISGLASLFNSFCSRSLIVTAADVTEYYFGAGPYLQLKRYPIVSITTIKESWIYDFDNTDALVADTDYRLLNSGDRGVLYRIYSAWPMLPDSIQAVYKGGYCAAGVTPGDGQHALPDDLREAAIQQASFIFKRKDDIGLTAVSFEGGSISKFSAMDLLPMVKDTLNRYRKINL